MNIEELKNVSLSEATMRPEDLIPCFISALRQIDPENIGLMKSLDEMEEQIGAEDRHGNVLSKEYYESEAAQWDLDYLFDTLDAHVPEGFYFGSHPGDGSDYGFWECEDFDEEELEDDENSHRFQGGYCNDCAGDCQYDDQGNLK